MEQAVLYEKRCGIAYVTLNRSRQRNAIDLGMRKGLCEAWREIASDPEILSVILSGGENVFSAGQDLSELSAFRKSEPFADLPLNNIETFGARVVKPVIAAISGPCMGAGFLLTMICADIRIASESALFSMPEVKVGVPPSMGIPAILSMHFPPAVVSELLLFGKDMDARAAEKLGFVNAVVPVGEMLAKAEDYAKRIHEMSPLITANIKRVLRRISAPDSMVVAYSDTMCNLGRRSEDYLEGPKAFSERRKPVWKGR